MQTTVWEPSIKHSLRTSRILSCARKLSKNLVTMACPLVLTELKRTAWRIMQGSIWPVPSPPPGQSPGTSPSLRARGWEIVWGGPVPKVGVGQIKNIFPLILRSSRGSRWLRTSRLRIFKERRRNLSESVFKGLYLKRMCLWYVLEWILIFGKDRQKVFLQPSFNEKKTYMKTDTRRLI